MEYRTLGRTGLEVSVMGIGAGGPSRLGKRDDMNTEAESVDIVLKGLDAGINFIDTAEAYGTEDIVGKAVTQRDRSDIIISTKKRTWDGNFTPDDVVTSVEESLRRLQTDYIDVYHIHGLKLKDYDYCMNDIVPVMERLRDDGKIRFIGVTEAWNSDVEHEMLSRAVQDDVWDVLMVGFNVLNQTARDTILKASIEKNLGILIMFAIRRALSRPDKLKETIQQLIETGEVDGSEIDVENPLGFLLEHDEIESIPDAAYRFCREEAGTHVILSGTSNPKHLQANIEALNRPPLPDDVTAKLKHLFRNVHSVTGE